MGRASRQNILITAATAGSGWPQRRKFDREGARVAICGLNERTLQAAKGTLGAGSLAIRATSAISPTSTRCSPRSSGVRTPRRRLGKCRLQRLSVVSKT